MSQITRKYTIRRFESSSDPDYLAALGVYLSHVTPDIRTKSNEITYWLDQSYKQFGDEFIILGFFVEKRVIGFAELAYFAQSRILVFDYLVLHKEYRSHGEYFQFARMIQDWIANERLEFDYAVAEVSYESTGDQPSERSLQLAQLFQYIGFSIVDCDYLQAPLGDDNIQSGSRAFLLVGSCEALPSLKKATVLHIARTGYIEHHLRWYTPFLTDPEKYRAGLERRLTELDKAIKSDEIRLKHKRMFERAILPPRAPRASKQNNLVSPLVVIFAYSIFCIAFFVIQTKAQLPLPMVALLFLGSMVVFAGSFALFSEDGRSVFRTLLDSIIRFFGTRK